jgi:ABC-type polysaccharide/polyol phosphate transport system ATPase subunit
MGANAIEIEQVSKRYLLGERSLGRGTLRESLTSGLRALGRGRGRPPEEVWSLCDVSFAVPEGAALGVIGRNGAGKSTLLKVLARITEPTRGVARTRGRVGSLLEVGTGFHPELTGRENIYLNGALLGMGRREINRRFDDMVGFAGIPRFLDTPVKRYSSGMYLRLAFAVAAHLDAEVMLVDEVLAVGDAEFQRKCLGKMAEVEREGRTVLFVSHNLDAIARLCPTTVWLDQGRVQAIGATQEVVASYLSAGVVPRSHRSFDDRPAAPVALRQVEVGDAEGRLVELLRRDEPFTVALRFMVREPVPGLDLAVSLQALDGSRILDEAWSDTAPDQRGEPGEYVARLRVPPLLSVGDYTLSVWIGSAYETLVWEEGALSFRLEGSHMERPSRVLQLSLPWDVRVDQLSIP